MLDMTSCVADATALGGVQKPVAAMQMHGFSGLPLGESLPGSGSGDWFPTSPTAAIVAHRSSRTIGTTAELEKRPDSIQLFSPSSETAATSDPILGGELVIRVIDAQVCASSLFPSLVRCTKHNASFMVSLGTCLFRSAFLSVLSHVKRNMQGHTSTCFVALLS